MIVNPERASTGFCVNALSEYYRKKEVEKKGRI